MGRAGVEQGADPVVAEAAEPERHPLDPLDQVVDGFGRPVASRGSGARRTIWSRHLAMVRPSRRTSSGISRVGEVADDLVDPRLGELVGRCGRRSGGRPPWRSRRTTPRRLGSPAASRPSSRSWPSSGSRSRGHVEQAAGPVERVGLAAPMAERSRSAPGAGTHPAPGWRRARRGTGRRPGRRRAASCRTPSDRTPTDPASPSRSRPATRSGRAASQRHGPTRHDPATTSRSWPRRDVDDLGRPPLPSERAVTGEQGLVQPERGRRRRSGPGRRSAACRTRRRRPSPCASPSSRSAATSATERPWRPTCTVAHRAARVVNAQRLDAIRGSCSVQRPPTRRATPALLAPHQPGRAAEHRQIDQLDLADPVTMRRPRRSTTAARARSRSRSAATAATRRHRPRVTSGRPTSSAHMRVASVSNRGSSRLDRRQTPSESRAPVPRPGPLPDRSPHPQIRSARKGRHDPNRSAVRHGTEDGSVTLGGRRVSTRRPRVRSADRSAEVAVPAGPPMATPPLTAPKRSRPGIRSLAGGSSMLGGAPDRASRLGRPSRRTCGLAPDGTDRPAHRTGTSRGVDVRWRIGPSVSAARWTRDGATAERLNGTWGAERGGVEEAQAAWSSEALIAVPSLSHCQATRRRHGVHFTGSFDHSPSQICGHGRSCVPCRAGSDTPGECRG